MQEAYTFTFSTIKFKGYLSYQAVPVYRPDCISDKAGLLDCVFPFVN